MSDLNRSFTGWTTKDGQLNASLYAPGELCEVMNGYPINVNCWLVVTWYPGKETLMWCFGNCDEACRFINIYFGYKRE